jgi:hypothetical protein
MAMMAVHEQSMPKDRTNMLMGHLPPPRRCPMGPVIWTFGVPPHPDIVGPRAVSAALGRNEEAWSPLAVRSSISASPFIRDSYPRGCQGRCWGHSGAWFCHPGEKDRFWCYHDGSGVHPYDDWGRPQYHGGGANSLCFGGRRSVLQGFSEVWASKGVQERSCSPPSNAGSWMCIALMLDFTQWGGLSHLVACIMEEAEMSGPRPFWDQTWRHLHWSASSRSFPSSHGTCRDCSGGSSTARPF